MPYLAATPFPSVDLPEPGIPPNVIFLNFSTIFSFIVCHLNCIDYTLYCFNKKLDLQSKTNKKLQVNKQLEEDMNQLTEDNRQIKEANKQLEENIKQLNKDNLQLKEDNKQSKEKKENLENEFIEIKNKLSQNEKNIEKLKMIENKNENAEKKKIENPFVVAQNNSSNT